MKRFILICIFHTTETIFLPLKELLNEFVLITVNYSRRTSAGFVSLKNVDIYAKIYNDTIFLKRSYLYQENFPTYSLFTLQFNYNSEGKYIFDVYIEDDFYQNSSLLFSANMTVVYPILKPKFINTIAIPGSFLALFSLITTIFTVIFIYKGGNWLKIRISQWMESKKQKIQKLKPLKIWLFYLLEEFGFNPKSWDELKTLNIGIVTGWKIIEINARFGDPEAMNV
ncbi:MAG: hypothetical protein P8Y70_11090 [Candidatus Lokiarchaeota archaeon]